MRRPDFFIVGAPKCGTTAMYTYLKQHPGIFMPKDKEPHYFSHEGKVSRQLDWEEYLALFSNARESQLLGEASTLYLFSEVAARNIKKRVPDAKIIIMLRNPIDMLHSYHSHLVFGCWEDIWDFGAALDTEGDRRKGLRVPDAIHREDDRYGFEFVKALFYRDVAKFSEQVSRYFEVFDSSNVHVIIFDDFARNTEYVYQNLLRFLEVDTDFSPRFEVINANKVVRNRALSRLTTIPPDFCRYLLRGVMDGLLPSTLSHRLKSRLVGFLKSSNIRHRPRPPLDAELRRSLQVEFSPEVRRLGDLLGRSLDHWCSS